MAEAGGEVLELYNLARDPGERHNLATRRWETVLRLKNIALNYYRWVHVQHRCLHTASFNIQSPAVSRELVPPRFLGLQTTKHVGYDGHVFWPAACSLVPTIVQCICFWSRSGHFMTRNGVGSFSHDQEVVVIAINREGTMLRCLL